jgi:hypothetical protein
MKKLLPTLVLLFASLAAVAAPITMLDGFQVSPGKVGLRSDKMELRSSGSTGIATLKYADSVTTAPVITIPSSSGNDSLLLRADTATLTNKTLTSPAIGTSMVLNQTTGNYTFTWANPAAARAISLEDPLGTDVFVWKAATQTLTNKTISGGTISGTIAGSPTASGTWTFSNPPTITGGLTAANIQTGSAKREVLRAVMSPAGGAVTVNGTTYFGCLAFGRAGIVKRITYGTHVDPVSGTNTIKVLKNGASGNTMLNAASVSLNGATADVAQNATLTATSGDLSLGATDTVYCEYVAGTQGVVAKDVYAVVEFEPTDF